MLILPSVSKDTSVVLGTQDSQAPATVTELPTISSRSVPTLSGTQSLEPIASNTLMSGTQPLEPTATSRSRRSGHCSASRSPGSDNRRSRSYRKRSVHERRHRDSSSRHRSKDFSRSPPRRSRHRYSYRSPTSDSTDSDAGHKRPTSPSPKRRKNSPKGRREAERQEDRDWLFSQISAMIQPLLPQSTAEPPDPMAPSTSGTQRTEDALDCYASGGISDETPDNPPRFKSPTLHRHPSPVGSTIDDEEEPVRGASLPLDSMKRAAAAFRFHLGYPESQPTLDPDKPISKLSATNELAPQQLFPIMPVDATCMERFETLAKHRRWTAFPAQQDRAVRVPDQIWESLFRTPSVSQEAKQKARVSQGISSGLFNDPVRRTFEEELSSIDAAARSGLKFSSVFLLIAELLMHYHQQLPEDPNQVSRKEASQLLLLIGPLARLVFDQFSRIAIKSVISRRSNLLQTMEWPSSELKDSLLNLPKTGADLFNGRFQSLLEEELPLPNLAGMFPQQEVKTPTEVELNIETKAEVATTITEAVPLHVLVTSLIKDLPILPDPIVRTGIENHIESTLETQT